MQSSSGNQATGNWKILRGRVREAWGALTDDDVDRYEGKLDQLVGYIAQKTGEAREAVARKMDDISRNIRDEQR